MSGPQALALMLIIGSADAYAGCIGPVIDGKCHGREVPWETDGQDYTRTDPATPGARSDKHTGSRRQHPDDIDSFGGDPQDSSWLEPQPQQGRFR